MSDPNVSPEKNKRVARQDEAAAGGAAQPQGGAKRVALPLNKAMDRVYALYQAGRLKQAAQMCSQIVSQRPRNAAAHNLMAAILHAQGNRAAAVKSMQRAIHLDQNNAQFYANLGEMERRRGKLPEAMAALRRARDLDPNSPQTLNNLGIVHFDQGEFEKAAECYEQAIALSDSYPEAHNNLGNALHALGKDDEALEQYQRSLFIREDYPGAYNNMAAILRDRDQVAEAEFAYRKAIGLNERYFEAYSNLATLLVEQDRESDALRVLGEALKIDPKNVSILIQLARTHLERSNFEQAEQACRLGLEENPDHVDAHVVLGQVMHESDRFPEALASYEAALKLNPGSGDARMHYGICLKSVGRLGDAREQLLKAIDANPKAIGIYANLADMEKFTPDHPHLQTMEAIMQEASDPMSERYMALHFGLGKAYEDIGEYEKAFNHFKMGTTLKRAKLDYTETDTFGFFDSIREIFTEEFIANSPFEGDPTQAPVFIIGMPRSGSTLVEQIVSSHPQAFGAGEIKEFSRRIHMLRSRFPFLPKYPQMVGKLNRAHYAILAEGYLSTLKTLAPNALRVTDKLLTNYYFAGMLHMLFPNARFIHTKRNPVDTCWSAYTKLFKDDMPHSYDFGELGRYYRKYQELMAYWDRVLPAGTIKTIVYEDVVGDLEASARDMLDFLGLPFDPACLAFHESARPVKTASVAQVRKPVYKTSVEKWRRYGTRLQPLVDALGYEAEPEPARGE